MAYAGAISELYQTSKSNIREHIKHIFEEGELEENAVVRKFRTTAADGKNYNTMHYNPMCMTDYVKRLDNVLEATDEKVLQEVGTIVLYRQLKKQQKNNGHHVESVMLMSRAEL